MQVVHAICIARTSTKSPVDYLFMSGVGLVAACGVLWGLSRNVSSLVYLGGHWVLCWLVFSAEMYYNDLAERREIEYLSAARPFRWLSLRSLRFLYGGEPEGEVRAPMYFVVMLTTALTPVLP